MMVDDQTVYKGYKTRHQAGPGHVSVIEPGKPPRMLPKRLDLHNHSPDGFQWGYGGSGPLQLALALLADACDDQHALSHYQEYKRVIISVLAEEWEINAKSIREMTRWIPLGSDDRQGDLL